MATPRTLGRLPNHLEQPALPRICLYFNGFETWPKQQRVLEVNNRCSPEGNFTRHHEAVRDKRIPKEPAARAIPFFFEWGKKIL